VSFSSPTTAALHYQRIGKARQRARRAAGLCSSCAKPAVISPKTGLPMSRCQSCREASTRASRAYIARHRAKCKTAGLKRRQRYASQGLCQCGRPMAEGRRACANCRGRNTVAARKYAATKRWRYQDAGLCLRCDRATGLNRSTGKPYRHCLWHRIEQANSAKARRHAREQVAA